MARRKSGTGTVRHRRDGRWEGRVVVGYDDRGLPVTKNVLGKSKRECEAKLKSLRAQLTPPKPDKLRADMPFGDWLDRWYQEQVKPRLRPKSREDYENEIYNHIVPRIGKVPLNKISVEVLQQFYTELKQNGRLTRRDIYGPGVSDRLVEGCHFRIRSALAEAVEERLIPRNPAEECKLPQSARREKQVLTREELQRFLTQAQEEGYYELVLLELATGLRRGEILALKWSDLNPKTGELRVERQVYRTGGKLTVAPPKTKTSARSLLIPKAMLDVLNDMHTHTASEWIFPSPVKPDSPLDPASVRKRIQTILDHAGCRKLRFHDLRHTFATLSLEAGMDVKTLSAIIGHNSVSTTLNVYTHVTDTMRAQAAAAIDRAITGSSAPTPAPEPEKPSAPFHPYKGLRRRAGTGCITRVSENRYEGKYTPRLPNGTRYIKTIYAASREECEAKLAALIAQVKPEVERMKREMREGNETSKTVTL